MAVKDIDVLRGPGVDLRHDGALIDLDPKTLQINPRNIRMLGSAAVKDLSDLDSVVVHGVIEPLVVTPDLVIVCGHRRQAKAIEVGLETVPCVVRSLSEAEQIEVALSENLGRTGITPTEEGVAYQMLVDLGLEVETLASNVGVKVGQVVDRLELLELPPVAQQALSEGRIGHHLAKRLLLLKDHPAEIEKLAKRFNKYGDQPINELWEIDQILQTIRTNETKTKLKAEAKKKGVPVVGMPPAYGREVGKPVRIGKGFNEIDLDLKKHRKLLCHAFAIAVNGDKGELVPVCSDPAKHEGVKDPAEPLYPARDYTAEREMANRISTGLREGRPGRLAHWRKLIDEEGTTLLDLYRRGVAANAVLSRDASELCEFLGLEAPSEGASMFLLDWLVEDPALTKQREQRLYLAAVAFSFDGTLTSGWRGWDKPIAVHLAACLRELGYQFNEVENELWDNTADIRTKMDADLRFNYAVLNDEVEGDQDEWESVAEETERPEDGEEG